MNNETIKPGDYVKSNNLDFDYGDNLGIVLAYHYEIKDGISIIQYNIFWFYWHHYGGLCINIPGNYWDLKYLIKL